MKLNASVGAPAGAALMAACLCSMAAVTFGGLALAGGAAVIALNLQAALMVGAAGLILYGLYRRSTTAAGIAAAGFALLGAGYLLAPPAIMTSGAVHTGGDLLGFALTFTGALTVAGAFLRAFPVRDLRGGALAAGGFGAAAGCGCCLTTGSALWLWAGLGLAVPASQPWIDGIPFALFSLVAIAGVWVLGGRRWALLALAGAALAIGADEGFKVLDGGLLERVLRLGGTIAGLSLFVYAIAGAFRANRRAAPAAEPPVSEPVRA